MKVFEQVFICRVPILLAMPGLLDREFQRTLMDQSQDLIVAMVGKVITASAFKSPRLASHPMNGRCFSDVTTERVLRT